MLILMVAVAILLACCDNDIVAIVSIDQITIVVTPTDYFLSMTATILRCFSIVIFQWNKFEWYITDFSWPRWWWRLSNRRCCQDYDFACFIFLALRLRLYHRRTWYNNNFRGIHGSLESLCGWLINLYQGGAVFRLEFWLMLTLLLLFLTMSYIVFDHVFDQFGCWALRCSTSLLTDLLLIGGARRSNSTTCSCSYL